jgi:uncharacterized protein (TIGR02118 family)
MGKMLVIYEKPADPAAFGKHYFNVHVPLAKRLPGLRRYEVSKGPIMLLSPGDTPYLVATLYFDSVADKAAEIADSNLGTPLFWLNLQPRLDFTLSAAQLPRNH